MDQHLSPSIEKSRRYLYQQLALYKAINSDAPREPRGSRSHTAERYLASADNSLWLHAPGDVRRISEDTDFKAVPE